MREGAPKVFVPANDDAPVIHPEAKIIVFPSPANDNRTERAKEASTEVDGQKIVGIRLTERASRVTEPFRWKEYKVLDMQRKVMGLGEANIVRYINESTPEDWKLDPVYFYALVEHLQNPPYVTEQE